MHYFIDGYNLLFRLVRAREGENLQKMREMIIEDLSRKITVLNLNATLVFDSYHHESLRSRTLFHSLELLFTDEGETADECILEELRKCKKPKDEMVVTSDKKLAQQARLKGAKTVSVEEFLADLNRRYQKRTEKRVEEKEKIEFKESKKAESLNDYYLRIFEADVPEKKESKKADLKLNKESEKKVRKEKKEEQVSDFERWLKAFQENADD